MTEKIRKTKLGYELETCSRCSGSGHYSYCQSHGTTCFKCGGTGVVLSKKGSATKNYFLEITTKSAGEAKVGDLVKDRKWLIVKSIEIRENAMQSNNGPWESAIDFTLTEKDGTPAIGFVTTSKSCIQCIDNLEQWKELHNQALDYQTKLTKTGKLMKKYQ